MNATARMRLAIVGGSAIALMGASAEAHLSSSGMGPIYDGLMHFLMSPEDLVPALALGLFAGLRGPAHSRRVLFVLPSMWLLGSLVGLHAAAISGSAITSVSAIWFLLIGGLVVADAKLSIGLTTALAGAVGLYHGYLNGTGMGASVTAAVTVFGLVSSVFVLVALAAAFAVQLQQHRARIAIRVVGSWVAASGMLLLGWIIRGG